MIKCYKETDRLPIYKVSDDGVVMCSKCRSISLARREMYKFDGDYFCRQCVSFQLSRAEYEKHFK